MNQHTTPAAGTHLWALMKMLQGYSVFNSHQRSEPRPYRFDDNHIVNSSAERIPVTEWLAWTWPTGWKIFNTQTGIAEDSEARDLLNRIEAEQNTCSHDEGETRALFGLCEDFLREYITESEKPQPQINKAIQILSEIANKALDAVKALDISNV